MSQPVHGSPKVDQKVKTAIRTLKTITKKDLEGSTIAIVRDFENATRMARETAVGVSRTLAAKSAGGKIGSQIKQWQKKEQSWQANQAKWQTEKKTWQAKEQGYRVKEQGYKSQIAVLKKGQPKVAATAATTAQTQTPVQATTPTAQ